MSLLPSRPGTNYAETSAADSSAPPPAENQKLDLELEVLSDYPKVIQVRVCGYAHEHCGVDMRNSWKQTMCIRDCCNCLLSLFGTMTAVLRSRTSSAHSRPIISSARPNPFCCRQPRMEAKKELELPEHRLLHG